MNKYLIFTARKNYNDYNEFYAKITAENLDAVKNIIRGKMLNPFYSLIINLDGEILYNEFLPPNYKKPITEYYKTKGTK